MRKNKAQPGSGEMLPGFFNTLIITYVIVLPDDF